VLHHSHGFDDLTESFDFSFAGGAHTLSPRSATTLTTAAAAAKQPAAADPQAQALKSFFGTPIPAASATAAAPAAAAASTKK
jgi:hypothetical protein